MQICFVQVKNEGFDLTSRETGTASSQQNKQASSMEGDAWAMNLTGAENVLLGKFGMPDTNGERGLQAIVSAGNRRKTLSILKCLRDTHLDFPGTPITNYILKTLMLYECEKHCNDYEWEDNCIGDRIIGELVGF